METVGRRGQCAPSRKHHTSTLDRHRLFPCSFVVKKKKKKEKENTRKLKCEDVREKLK